MFHDLLDVLYDIAKPEQTGRGGPPKDDGFRGSAKEFRGEEPERLHHLSIPQDESRDLVKLVLVMQFDFGGLVGQIEKDGSLDRVADCVLEAFALDPNLGITWEMFNRGNQVMPELLVITVSYHPFANPAEGHQAQVS